MEGMGSAMVLPGGANSLGLTLAGTSTAGKLLSSDGADEASKLTPWCCPKRQGSRVSRCDVLMWSTGSRKIAASTVLSPKLHFPRTAFSTLDGHC